MPAGSRGRCSSLASLFAASSESGRMIAIQRFRRTARKQCVLVVEHRAIAPVSIYRRVKPRALSKIATTHALLADLHCVDPSYSHDSPVVRLTGASRLGANKAAASLRQTAAKG